MDEKKQYGLFLDLYSKTQARLYAFILMLVHSNHDADEIFQETSILLWEKFDQYQEGTNFGVWATAIAKFQVFEYMRNRKKEKDRFSQLIEAISNVAVSESENIDKRLNALQKCLYKLDRISRLLLTSRYKQNISVKELAQRKGISAGAMYRKLTRIFNALRKCVNLSLSQQR